MVEFDQQKAENAQDILEETGQEIKAEKEDLEEIMDAIDSKHKNLQTAKANLEEAIQLNDAGNDHEARERLKHAVRRLKELTEIDEREAAGLEEIMGLDKQEKELEQAAMKALMNLTDLSGTPLDKNPG